MSVKFVKTDTIYEIPKTLYKVVYLIPIDKSNEQIFKSKSPDAAVKVARDTPYKITVANSKSTINSNESNRVKYSYTSFESEKGVTTIWVLQILAFTMIVVLSSICINSGGYAVLFIFDINF